MTGRSVLRVLTALVALAANLAPIGARANQQTVEHADDSAGPMDIAAVRQGHYFEQILYRITAYERLATRRSGRRPDKRPLQPGRGWSDRAPGDRRVRRRGRLADALDGREQQR